MHTLKKYPLLFIALAVFSVGLLMQSVEAQESYTNDLANQLQATAGEDGAGFAKPSDPRAIAGQYIRVFLSLIGVVLIGYTVYAGYLIMTSAGNTDQLDTGKKTLRNGVIGLLIVMSAYSITLFAVRFSSGDAARSGDYIEIRRDQYPNQDPLNRGTSPDAFSPLPAGPDGNRGIYGG